MRTYLVLFLAAVFALSPLEGIAADKQVKDVKELAGSWRGWVVGEQGDERATMIVSANGSYKASTITGSTTEGQVYLKDGKLLYRSSQPPGTAKLAEDKGTPTPPLAPEAPNSRPGTGRYERVK